MFLRCRVKVYGVEAVTRKNKVHRKQWLNLEVEVRAPRYCSGLSLIHI